MEKIKVGIIGFGFMGHNHADMVQSFDEMELVAVCDTNPEQLTDVPAGVKIYDNADDLLKEDINVVIISVPNPLHKEMTVKAARAGKHIICEKPAAMSVAEFDEMVKVTQGCNVMFTIHHQRRWDYDYRRMKAVFDQNLVGDVYIIKSQLYGVNGNMHDWHIYPEMGGGMLYDWGVHLIDQILQMVPSEIDTIFADVKNVINEKVDDYFNIIVRFKNNITAEIELGTYYLTPKRGWFIGGNKGSAMIDDFSGAGKIVRTKHLLKNVPGKITMTAAGPTRSFGPPEPGLLYEEPLPDVECSHRDYFVNFINAYYGKEELMVKNDQVRRILRFLDAVRESARTNKAIKFE
ncbi:Gfo/Idh/MocA family oxidoreductase [Catenibacillus scindens]|uniref:Gfo/Idh/MocA family protein n=1 Tax=Catenibacillus scindens TaxID=673271 RepID=UPI003207F128